MAAQSTQSTPSAPAPASGSNRHPPASVANTKGIVPGNIVVVKSLAYNGVTWVAIGPDGQNFGMTEAIVVYRSPGQTCHFGNDLQCLTVSMVEKVPAAPGGTVLVDFTDYNASIGQSAPPSASAAVCSGGTSGDVRFST